MQYKEIVAVTGLGGLFQLLATKSDGAIVRSLADNTTRFIPSRLHSVTPLESIEIYTTGSNVRLHEVLQQMKDDDTEKPDAKKDSTEEIRSYFKDIFPDIDDERVYASDMKKMLKWYEILHGADLLDFSSVNNAAEMPAEAEGTPEEAAAMPAEGAAQINEHEKEDDAIVPLVEEGDEQPGKKARTGKDAAAEEADAETPANKTAAKKKEEAPKKTEME